MSIRKPHVAGTFYPSDPSELRHFFESHNLFRASEQRQIKAVMLPHAGYVYSGKTACDVLSQVEVPEKVILIGPDHWARGSDFSLYDSGEWHSPLGSIVVDEELASLVLSKIPQIQSNQAAHQEEHSLEVILPMLQAKRDEFAILPLVVSSSDMALVHEVALKLGDILSHLAEPPLIIISSDMNHYESDAVTRVKDRYAIDAILDIDAERLRTQVTRHRISMCGFLPAYMVLTMRDKIDLHKATLIDYTTSAETSEDYERVVGYAGVIFE